MFAISVEKKSIMGPLKDICSTSPYSFKRILNDISNNILEYMLDKYNNKVHLMINRFNENKKNYVIVIYPSYRSQPQEMRIKLGELTKDDDTYYVSDINNLYIPLTYCPDDEDNSEEYKQNLYDKMDKLCASYAPVEEINRYKSLIWNISKHPIMGIFTNMIYNSEYIQYIANNELCGIVCKYSDEGETIATFHYSKKGLTREQDLVIHHPYNINKYQVFELVLKATKMMMNKDN